MSEPLIFERSSPGRGAYAQRPAAEADFSAIPEALRRKAAPVMPEVSELQAVRHYTRLSKRNFSIDTHFYPLGSCTMKYNPRACNTLAMLPEFLQRHPLAPMSHSQGFLACMYDLQEILKDVTGMAGVSLTPMAGAQGEFAGVAMIRAYHRARGDDARTEILVPDAAHGTNPATATMMGYTTREIPTNAEGDVDIEALQKAVGPHTAGIMLTNPSTLGVFERRIKQIAGIVHEAGGLLYYDGANLNAISRQGAARRHGLRRDPHEPAQDLQHAAWRRWSGRRCGRRFAASAAVHADPAGRQVRRERIAGWKSAICRSRSAACRPSWATPAC
jgi:glycine dehydrogenase subunit 2